MPVEGMVTDSYLPIPTDTSNSWIKLLQTVNQKYDNNAPFDGNVLYGASVAYTFLQVLKAAGQKLNRGSLVAAVEKCGFTGPGLVAFRFSATDHSGSEGTQIAVTKGGVATLTGSIFTTDDTGGPLTVYSGSAITAPANGLP